MRLPNFFKILKRKKEKTIGLVDILGSKGKITITIPELAYELVGTVYACVTLIMQNVAKIPIYAFRFKDDKKEYLTPEDKFYRILQRPNSISTTQDFIEQIIGYLLTRGIVYLWVQERSNIWVLPDNYVEPDSYLVYPPNKWYIRQGTEKIEEERENVIPIKLWSSGNPYKGVSPVYSALNTINLDKNVIELAIRYVENAAFPGGLLVLKGLYSEEAKKVLLASLKSEYAGVEKAGKIMVLEGEVEFIPLSQSLEITKLIDQRKMHIEEICRVFGVPPALVSNLEYANYSNMREQTKVFWTQTIIPKVKKLENIFNTFLCPLFERNLGVEFDLLAVAEYQEIEREKWTTLMDCVKTWVLTINEAREMMGYPPVPWGDSIWGSMTQIQLATLPPEQSYYQPPPLGKTEKEDKIILFDNFLKQEERENRYLAFSSRRRLTKDELKRIWRKFDLHLGRREDKIKKTIAKLFKQQKEDVIKRLREIKSKAIKQEEFEIVFDFDKWVAIFQNSLQPLYRIFMADAAAESFIDLDLTLTFDTSRPEIQRFLIEETGKQIRHINETTRKEVIRIIKEGLEQGLAIYDIEQRLIDYFSWCSRMRAETIARTETLRVVNFGHLEAFRQSEIVAMKQWVATQDERVRDAHLEADGQVVELDEPFEVGGEYLDYPGDPKGSPENIINCRCTIVPVLKEEF